MYDMNLSSFWGNQRIVSQISLIVSPCISPGEKQIATAVLEAQFPLIVLLLKGFPPFFKPQPRYLMACAEGRLLMLSPNPWQNKKLKTCANDVCISMILQQKYADSQDRNGQC